VLPHVNVEVCALDAPTATDDLGFQLARGIASSRCARDNPDKADASVSASVNLFSGATTGRA